MVAQFGISIPSLPFTLSGFEAVLLFYEYPTTIIYEDADGHPVVREWVDCSEDSKTDRYYYYRANKTFLKRFLSKEIPYRELINQNLDGYVIFEDRSIVEGSEYFISSMKSIPENYLSQPDYYFEPEEAVDLSIINDHFGLDKVIIADIGLSEAKAISTEKKSETLFVHFKKGKGIGFGTANTEVLAKTLLKFDRFYKEAALDFKLGTTRGEIQLNAKKNEQYLPYTTTEVYGNIAASYAVLLRPVFSTQTNLFGQSEAEKISSSIFSLIGNSETLENLKEEYPKHSDFALKAYKIFVEEVYSSELNIGFSWFSPISSTEFTDTMDYVKANRIKNNIENLSIEAVEKFTIKGKFRSLNCDTGHFIFISTGGEKYNGYMDDLVREGSETINFIDVYEITISRTTSKEAGNKVTKITDTILAFTVDKT